MVRNAMNILLLATNLHILLSSVAWPSLPKKHYNGLNQTKVHRRRHCYTNIPHTKRKSRLAELIRNAFRFKNGKKRYEYIDVSYKSTYFVKNHSEAKHK